MLNAYELLLYCYLLAWPPQVYSDDDGWKEYCYENKHIYLKIKQCLIKLRKYDLCLTSHIMCHRPPDQVRGVMFYSRVVVTNSKSYGNSINH